MLSLRLLATALEWACMTLAFSGVTFSLTAISSDPYANFAVCVLGEVPGIAFVYFFLNRLGRKVIVVLGQALASLCILGCGLLTLRPDLLLFQLALAFCGKFLIREVFVKDPSLC